MQGGQDEGPMLLEPSGTAEAANTERQETAVAEEPVRELPPTGAIKFQPTSKSCTIASLHCIVSSAGVSV